MPDDDTVQSTVRLPKERMEWLRSELSHFSTDAARFQFLVQFYADYKEMGYPPSVTHITCKECAASEQSNNPDDTE